MVDLSERPGGANWVDVVSVLAQEGTFMIKDLTN